jgi:hypothetical protein
MSISRARGAARQHGRLAGRRVRFREAVPVWHDRRDLRRLFRRAAHAALSERRAEMTQLLQRLSADQVPLWRVVPGPRAREGVVAFTDGTQLLVVARRGSGGMKWLSEPYRCSGALIWLVRAQPSFASCWFRLWFASAGAAKPTEVLARVGPVPA